jgi:hypothetical protein
MQAVATNVTGRDIPDAGRRLTEAHRVAAAGSFLDGSG